MHYKNASLSQASSLSGLNPIMQPLYYQRHTQHVLTLPPQAAKDPHYQMLLLGHALPLNVGLKIA